MTKLDIDQYMRHLEKFDLTDAKKREFIEAYWEIVKDMFDRTLAIGESNRQCVDDKEKIFEHLKSSKNGSKE